MKKVYWDEAANPIGTHLANIIYELRSEDDGEDLILDAVCLEDFEETAETVAYDALVTEYRLLERKMNVMRRVMNRVTADLKVREDNGPDDMGVIISKPFKRNGTSNVAALFQLTDGQTISIVFHNPDTTPNRIMPTDELISWKWMINKKDVTIVVAPEKGQDLNVNEVARRIMRLAEKNSARFQAANAKRAERIANIENQKAEIEGLERSLSSAKSDYEAAEVAYNDALQKLENLKKERDKAVKEAQVRAEERIMQESKTHDTKEQAVEDLPPPVSEVTETEEAKPAAENPEGEDEAVEDEDSGESRLVKPDYPIRQVKVSDLIKGGRLWDKGGDISRIYLKRANLFKLSGFKLELSSSGKNMRNVTGPDGVSLNYVTAHAIYSLSEKAYWDNVKKQIDDPMLTELLCLELIDDVTGTDKDITPGTVGPYADLMFPDIHVPVPEGFVPVLDPLHAAKERKKAKAKRKKPKWSWIMVEGETDKAYKVRYGDPEGYFDGNEQSFDRRAYIPKSQCVVEDNHLAAVAKWVAEKYGFAYSIEPVTVVPREAEANKKPIDLKEGRHDLTSDQENELFDLLYDGDLIGDAGKHAVDNYGGKPKFVKSELTEFTEGRKNLVLGGYIDGGEHKDVQVDFTIEWRPNAGLAMNVASRVWGISISRQVADDTLKARIGRFMGVDLAVPDEADETNADPKRIRVSKIVKLGKLWEKGGNIRTYFNGEIDDVLELIGFKTERSSNGRVMSVTDPDGEVMSNNKWFNLRASLFKSYYDHVSGEFKNRYGVIDMEEKFDQWDITFVDDLQNREEEPKDEPVEEPQETSEPDPDEWRSWPLETPEQIINFTENVNHWANPSAEGSKGQMLVKALCKKWKTFSGKNDDETWFTISFEGDAERGDGDWTFHNTEYEVKSPTSFIDLVIEFFKKAHENGSLTAGQPPKETVEAPQDVDYQEPNDMQIPEATASDIVKLVLDNNLLGSSYTEGLNSSYPDVTVTSSYRFKKTKGETIKLLTKEGKFNQSGTIDIEWDGKDKMYVKSSFEGWDDKHDVKDFRLMQKLGELCGFENAGKFWMKTKINSMRDLEKLFLKVSYLHMDELSDNNSLLSQFFTQKLIDFGYERFTTSHGGLVYRKDGQWILDNKKDKPFPIDTARVFVFANEGAVPVSETEEAKESTGGDTQWESDKAYLQTLIDGTADMADRKTHRAKLGEIHERVKGDPDKLEVLKRALKAWQDYALGRASAFKG